MAYYVINNNMGYEGDLDLLSIGIVNDMYAESGNDSYTGWKRKAVQSDFDAF